MSRMFQFAFVASTVAAALCGQARRVTEPLSSWPYFKEIRPGPNQTGLLEIVLDRDTLDKARADEADLRLYDNAGREIPYVLRVRRNVNVEDEYQGREFNRAVKDGAVQISIDLGEQPHEHNEVLIETAGNNFRRLTDVEGSSDGIRWATLTSRAELFRFTADGRTVEQQSIPYPVSRYRFLRVSVDRDLQTDQSAPELKGVRVRRLIRLQGEFTQVMGSMEPRQSDRLHGRAASIWRIDLGGRIPVERITVAPAEGDYSRPFELEADDDPNASIQLASGELVHHDKPGFARAKIDFAERFARHLKLTVIDDRNEPLPISGVAALGAARQVVFEAAAADRSPLRLYYGNKKAPAPHYDLDARIPANAVVQLTRLGLGPQQQNPVFLPEPKPFSERQPWVVYVVLIAACAILAWLLLNIARASKVETVV